MQMARLQFVLLVVSTTFCSFVQTDSEDYYGSQIELQDIEDFYWPRRFYPRVPTRTTNYSCAILTRIVLGGAWLANLDTFDIVCPPKLPEACYLVFKDLLAARDQGQKACLEYGLNLWYPHTSNEEAIMRAMLTNMKVKSLVMGIRGSANNELNDLLGYPIMHDSLSDFYQFTNNDCLFFNQVGNDWSVRSCSEKSVIICSIY